MQPHDDFQTAMCLSSDRLFPLSSSAFPLLNAAGVVLEKTVASRNHQFSVNYSVFAQK